jgi:oligopeptide/dipeptide ABC transporter ATP-binding protein
MKYEPLLKIENLKVHFFTEYGTVRAVDNVSWELSTGETLGIVGESGCGKSVTALSILRLVPEPPGKIVEGKIWYQGKDLLTLPVSGIRKIRGNEISIVFQDPVTSLNPSFTIGNQILEALNLHQDLKGKKARDKAIDLLRSVGIPSSEQRLKEYPHELSGGMNQRVMIAIALACNPRILIADEPTTALDVTIQAQIMDLFKSIRKQSNMAIILITHDLGLVSQLVEKVIVMYAGQIVESGYIQGIFRSPHHPYTKGLLRAIPRLTGQSGTTRRKLEEIPGVVPNLIDTLQGCAFYERCQSRMALCKVEKPVLNQVGDYHLSRCWLNQS